MYAAELLSVHKRIFEFHQKRRIFWLLSKKGNLWMASNMCNVYQRVSPYHGTCYVTKYLNSFNNYCNRMAKQIYILYSKSFAFSTLSKRCKSTKMDWLTGVAPLHRWLICIDYRHNSLQRTHDRERFYTYPSTNLVCKSEARFRIFSSQAPSCRKDIFVDIVNIRIVCSETMSTCLHAFLFDRKEHKCRRRVGGLP